MALYQSLVTVNPVTLIAQICNLFITLFFFKKFFWVKILDILDQRRLAADKEISDAQAARTEAMALKSACEQTMQESRAAADQLLLSAQQTAARRSDEMILDAKRTAVHIRQKASADIALEKKKALNDAKNDISEIALAIAGKVVGRELNNSDQQALVDNFIEELGGLT